MTSQIEKTKHRIAANDYKVKALIEGKLETAA